MSTVYVGMGSNIDAEANLKHAAALLREKFPRIQFSSVYRTAPQGKTDQPEFLNAVAKIETSDSVENISSALQRIEAKLKKSISERYGPRTIDLDVLLFGLSGQWSHLRPSHFALRASRDKSGYGGQAVVSGQITIPHPKMHERRFVLEPLIELAGENFLHPVLKVPLGQLLQKNLDQYCERMSTL